LKVLTTYAAIPKNYKSKTAWLKEGRRVDPDALPVAYFARETGLVEPPSCYPFIRQEGRYHRVAVQGWCLFDLSQTSPKSSHSCKSIKEEQNNNNNNIHLHKCHTDDPNNCRNLLSPKGVTASQKNDHLRQNRPKTPSNTPNNGRKKRNNNTLLVPKGITFENDKERYFIHRCLMRPITHAWGDGEFMPFHSDLLQKELGKSYKKHLLRMENAKIIECDHEYQTGWKATGYRLAEPVRQLPVERIFVEDPFILKNISERETLRYKVHRWLKKNLFRITIAPYDDGFIHEVAKRSVEENSGKKTLEEKTKLYRAMLRLVDEGEFRCSVGNNSRRFYTNITGMKRELRSLLRVDDLPLAEIDLANSQPLFLAVLLNEKGVEAKKYIELCEEGLLYDHFQDRFGKPVTRDKIKRQFLTVFYGSNCFTGRVKEILETEFPAVAEYVHKSKRKKSNRLAIRMQQAESRFFVRTVAERMMNERPEMFVATIHDSVLCLSADVDYVETVVKDEFAKIGVSPTLRKKG